MTRSRMRTAATMTVWAAACAAGLAGLAGYQATPGRASAVSAWPAGTSLRPAGHGADTLVVVVHPKCPCSRATISDLAVLLAHCPPGRIATTVLFVRPAGVPAGWERTDLWDAAAAIPGVAVLADPGGVEADRFGAVTSGQAILFDAGGRVAFRGGLTPGRGHAGDSGGAAAVVAVADGRRPADAQTPVFGCPISAERGSTCRP